MHSEFTSNNGTNNSQQPASLDQPASYGQGTFEQPGGFQSAGGSAPEPSRGATRNGGERGRDTGAGSAVASDEAANAMAPALAASLRASLQSSLARLNGTSEPDSVIHAVRRGNKSTIATFWLLKPWVNAESHERAHALVRESSRLLQKPRRAVALLRTLGELGQPAESASPEVIEHHLAEESHLPGEVLEHVKRLLMDALDEIASWPGERVADREVLSRFQKTRKRTLRRTRAARDKASPSRLHSLRKEVKRHTALHHALAPFVEHKSGTKHLDALADRLGNVNDLEDLKVEMKNAKKAGVELHGLDRKVKKAQQKEIKSSLALARKVLKKLPRKA